MKKEAFLIAISASIALGASNQKDLELINANAAYDQRITGSGVKIGVIDGPANMDHPSLSNQIADHIYSEYPTQVIKFEPNFSVDIHGSHVTSIIVGEQLGQNLPYGVAYGAKSYNVQITGSGAVKKPKYPDIYTYFKNNGVIAINNSWNSQQFPLVGVIGFTQTYGGYSSALEARGYEYVLNELAFKDSTITKDLSNLSKENLSVIVFAAGNEGISSPGLYGVLPSYDESLKSWITVGAVDSSKITKDSSGRLKLEAKAVSPFGNGLKGATNYSLVAPGTDINGANAAYRFGSSGYFRQISGTSQAAPQVTAAAALVSQKFPFLDPKQIADVLLSTANNDFEAPKLIVRTSKGRKNEDIYTVFYIDNEIPKKNEIIDKETIKKDLIAAGYSNPDSIVNQPRSFLYHDEDYYPWVQKVTKADVFGQGILDIQKAMGGLAVLDANRLTDNDVMRINKTLGKQALENKNSVFYTIKVDAQDDLKAEFTNDISQRKWNETTHQQNPQYSYFEQKVINKPTKLNNLDVGLKKTGDGVLVLSGKNTYEGPTVVVSGELVLNGSISKINSNDGNVYIENGATFTINNTMLKSDPKLRKENVSIGRKVLNEGIFRGIGTVEKTFINRGVLKAGFYDENTQENITNNDIFRVNGTFIQDTKNAEIQFAFTKNSAQSVNTQLIADSYKITDGKLVYVPLHSTENLLQVGETIDIDIDSKILNSSNLDISVQNRNLINFELQSDKKTIKVTMSNAPTTPDSGNTGGTTDPVTPPSGGGGTQGGSTSGNTQGGGSTGSGGGQSSSGSSSSGSGDNTGGNTQGGSGSGNQDSQPNNPNTPTQPSQPTQSEEQPNQPQNPSGNTGDNNQNNNTGAGNQTQNNQTQNQNQNQNQNNQAEQIATQQVAGQQAATLAAVPPSSPDAPIKALQGLLNNAATLSPQSTAALAQLDNLPSAQFSDALNAMKNTPTNTNIDSIDTMQKDLTIKNALFLMDPASSLGSLNTSSSVFAPTAAFGDEYLGKVDDVFIKTELSAGIAYRHTDHDDYKQNSYLLDLQAKKALSDSTLLGGFIGLSHSKTGDDLSDTRSNMFSLGLSLNHNFDSFGVLLGASAGMSFNRYEQSIKYLSNAKSDANYKNYFANFQGGVYKSFKLSENFNLTPIALLDYSVIRQDSFSQSGALAKNYEVKTTHFSRGWLGANLVYNTELNNNWRFNTSLFAFYWRKFNHKDINQNLSFVEASDQKFLANTSRSEKQGFYGGVAFGASKGNKFFRISLSDEKARAYNQYEIMLRAGLSF
ncbi:MAG: S8 family serine peptidase [Campylobacter sp.]|uniref:S8 family serine peptidase n=1 Tax=Campylobacter sp. TaxID=205 RepID=UPI002AA766F7|nr:S8 family serine peptidase [Campylobacter sp.]MCI6579700.1 S8 family serine peptidase [Campylobacter sp.]